MGSILVIGGGGVGAVVVKKCAQFPELFSEISVASRTPEKCEAIVESIDYPAKALAVDATSSREIASLIRKTSPDVVINTALPIHNLPIMDACLETGVHYIDTSAPEPDENAYEIFCYDHQLKYNDRYTERGIVGMLSVGFDPGVTNIFCAYAAKHLFDELLEIDILDCNGGNHGHPFATNFNPVVNLQEITQDSIHWENGDWTYGKPLSSRRDVEFQEIGEHPMYLIYHEELETLVRRFPDIQRIRFWMHFSDQYIQHLDVLQNIGMISMDPVKIEGKPVRPLEFLRAVLPDPASLAQRYQGKTNIGCLVRGRKDGGEKTYYLYNICDHKNCFAELGSQAISYTAGVPAVIGAKLLLSGAWNEPGVRAPEDWDPDPFMEEMAAFGLPWVLEENPGMGQIS